MLLKDKIRLYFMVLVIIPVLIMSGIIIFEEQSLVNINANDSGNALFNQEMDSLHNLVLEQSQFVESSFSKIDADLQIMSTAYAALFNGQFHAPTHSSYYWNYTALGPNTVPGLHNDSLYDDIISYNVSTWYLPPSNINSTHNSIPVLDTLTGLYLNLSSNMDPIFQSIYKGNPNYYWLYIGFNNSGLYRIYPYVNLDTFLTYDNNHGYDMRNRFYYAGAVNHPNKTFFSDPYPEEGGSELIITASRAVYVNNTLLGVAAIDIRFETVLNQFINIGSKNNSYAFLISSNGKVIAHPRIERTNTTTLITELESNGTDFQKILTNMESGKYGNGTYSYTNGTTLLISYAPIPLTNYSLAIVTNENTVLIPVNNIRAIIVSSALLNLIILLVVLIIILFGIFITSKLVADLIVRPIDDLTKAMTAITAGDLDQDITQNNNRIPREIRKFQNAFDNFLTMLQFGNEDFYQNNLQRAYQTYTKALTVFETNENINGVGICLSSLGKIERLWGNYESALNLYNSAIAIAEKAGNKKALASRFNSKGILFLDQKDYQQAMLYFEKALQYYREIDNINGIATIIGNMGLLYSESDQQNLAEQSFTEALKIAKENYNIASLGYVSLNIGKYNFRLRRYDQAIEKLEEALACSRALKDVRLAVNVLEFLAMSYELQGDQVKAYDARAKQDRLHSRTQIHKQLMFVLDTSSSMAGARLYSAKAGFDALFERQVNQKDSIGLIIFNNQPYLVYTLQSKEDNGEIFRQRVKSVSANGMTCFYDSLALAVEELANAPRRDQKWIVALTDGEDNRSVKYNISSNSLHSIQRLIIHKKLQINIIVIGVGGLEPQIEQDLQNLCRITNYGKFIPIPKPSNADKTIREAFEEVEEIIAKSAQEVLEEFKIED